MCRVVTAVRRVAGRNVGDGYRVAVHRAAWGADAVRDSALGIADELERRTNGTGVRTLLIRRPGRYAGRAQGAPRRVYLAATRPGRTWLRQATVTDPRELLDWNLSSWRGPGQVAELYLRDRTPAWGQCSARGSSHQRAARPRILTLRSARRVLAHHYRKSDAGYRPELSGARRTLIDGVRSWRSYLLYRDLYPL